MNIQILNFIKHRSHQQGDTRTTYQAGNEEEENCTVINQAVPVIVSFNKQKYIACECLDFNPPFYSMIQGTHNNVHGRG